jgi:preprotein translocase subunit SecF
MSVGALVALFHDVIITVGVYALSGFEVTPATVTGILTILGFSLYDTVVVFDKVRENTKNLARTHQTYAQAANLAVNQTLVRSINTSIVALLPVGALLYVGVVTLGSGALKDLALALFVGMAAGLYSSVFIAPPLVVQLKEMEPGVKAGDARAIRHNKRKEADRYAAVPTFSEDMPIYDEPAARPASAGEPAAEPVAGDGAGPERGVGQTQPNRSRYTAGDRPAGRPVSPSASSKRAQPERKPRSQRGKK